MKNNTFIGLSMSFMLLVLSGVVFIAIFAEIRAEAPSFTDGIYIVELRSAIAPSSFYWFAAQVSDNCIVRVQSEEVKEEYKAEVAAYSKILTGMVVAKMKEIDSVEQGVLKLESLRLQKVLEKKEM